MQFPFLTALEHQKIRYLPGVANSSEFSDASTPNSDVVSCPSVVSMNVSCWYFPQTTAGASGRAPVAKWLSPCEFVAVHRFFRLSSIVVSLVGWGASCSDSSSVANALSTYSDNLLNAVLPVLDSLHTTPLACIGFSSLRGGSTAAKGQGAAVRPLCPPCPRTRGHQPGFRRDVHQSHCLSGRLRRCEPPPSLTGFRGRMFLRGRLAQLFFLHTVYPEFL